jgi:hypothetical protein
MFSASSLDPYTFGEASTNPQGGNRNTDSKSIRTPRLNAGESTGVFIIVGQSNCCNSVPSAYSPANASKIDNILIYNGGTYAGADPMLGCENISPGVLLGNWVTRFADKEITGGKYARVILMPIGIGGTTIAQWAPGGELNPRLLVAPKRLASVGLTVSAFIWMQGESNHGTAQATYSAALTTVIGTPRASGFNAPWIIGKCTYITGTIDANVQAAQVAAPNGTTIFAGADTDTLTAASRQADNTHFTDAGSDAAAALWVTAVNAAI